MKKVLLLLVLWSSNWTISHAQLPEGSIAPDFTVTDINGNSHNLYNLLNQGYTVYLDFFATWCGICWNYHNTQALKNVWNQYGPPGTNQAYVISIEADANTVNQCLYGSSGCNGSSPGNWVMGTPHPIAASADIANLYQVSGYPKIYMVCPASKRVYLTGTLNAASLWDKRTQHCTTAILSTPAVTNANCLGSNTGQITLSASGATGPYTYNWSNGTSNTTGILSNIAAGTYACTVTPTQGGTATLNGIQVQEPPSALTTTLASTVAPGCNGVTGSMTIEAAGGWPGTYSYSWSNGQQTPQIANIPAGTYTVSVSDLSGCTKTSSFTLAAPPLVSAAIATPNQITCTSNTVQLNAANSSSGNNISPIWQVSNGGNILSGANTLTPVVNSAGTYTLLVTNSVSTCTASAQVNVSTNTTLPTAVITPANPLNCNNSQVQLNGAGSSQGSNFNYIWTTTNGNIVSGASSLMPLVNTAATYHLKVTNTQSGCTQTASVVVLQSAPITASATSVPATCNGNANGSISTSATGGSGAISYLWSNGATTATVTNLTAGQYMVVVTDSEGCSASAVAQVSQPTPLMANASATNQSINGINNGTAMADPIGGASGYTYIWSNNATSSSIANLAPGNYTVTVKDANNCTSVQIVTVNTFNCTLTASINATHINCFGGNNGTASVSLTGANNPVTFMWNNGATGAMASNLAVGNYTVSVTDANNCPVLLGVTISQPAQLLPNATATGVTSFGATNGTAAAAPVGGAGSYLYNWSTGSTASAISNLAPGTYTITITDINGCVAVRSVTVNAYDCAVSTNLSTMNNPCTGLAIGTATVIINGGTAPYSYNWSNGSLTATASNLSAGNYTVQVVDNNGCATTTIATITEPNALQTSILNVVNPPCPNTPNGTVNISVSGGNGNYTFLWNNGATSQNLTGVVAGNYQVIVSDANGCTKNIATIVPSGDTQPPIILASNSTIALNASGVVVPTLTTLNVQSSDNCGVSTLSFPPVTYTCSDLGQQTITISATDLSGNSTTRTITVTVLDITPPQLICPAAIVRCYNDNIVHFAAPTVVDNCTGGTLSLLNGLPSSASFPVGATTTQMFSYADLGGNTGFCTFNITIGAPITLQATISNNPSNGAIDLTVSGGTAPYTFQWTNDGQPFSTTEDLINLPVGTSYGIIVTDALGCNSPFQTFTVNTTLSADAPMNWSNISIQPNPSSGITKIVFSQIPNEPVSLVIMDATGREWLTQTIENTSIYNVDSRLLPEGIYLIHLQTSRGSVVKKWMVQRL